MISSQLKMLVIFDSDMARDYQMIVFDFAFNIFKKFTETFITQSTKKTTLKDFNNPLQYVADNNNNAFFNENSYSRQFLKSEMSPIFISIFLVNKYHPDDY